MELQEIEKTLLNLLEELKKGLNEYEKAQTEYIEKINEYKKQYSINYLKNKIEMGKATVNEIDSQTFIDTASDKLDADLAEGRLKAIREKNEVTKLEIETLRSLLSLRKSEIGLM